MNDIEKIIAAKNAKAFTKYIDYIRFPKLKNILKDTRIEFDFPISVFVGKNGSGKSTVLRSLYGCIEGKSMGDYWFSTIIDPIEEGDGERNCFIYNYYLPEDHPEKYYEVLIQRTKREKKHDVWETSKPVAKYNMLRKENDENYRKSQINNKLLYIDFHSVLSAFDKYRYALGEGYINLTKNYLRSKSRFLKNALMNNVKLRAGRYAYFQNDLPEEISQIELKIISQILEKTYKRAQIIRHKFFQNWGHSVVFELENMKYTEAFAGSGENAVIILVHEICKLPKGALILLDEPETCLHPGAQRKLFDFLIDICLKNKYQIVISTHSREFLIGLPNNAIKVFNELPNGYIDVIPECNPNSAFYFIGADIANKKTIIVEDRLSSEILVSVSKNMGDDIFNQLSFIYPPGGSKEIKKTIARFASVNDLKKYIVFDGDEKIKEDGSIIEIFNPSNLTEENRNSEYLKNLITEQTGIQSLDFFPVNSKATEEDKFEIYFNYLKFFHGNVFYLPHKIPEEIIWDDDFMALLCKNKEALIEEIKITTNIKNKFKMLSLNLLRKNKSDNIFNIQDLFITNWLDKHDVSYSCIVDIITKIINKD